MKLSRRDKSINKVLHITTGGGGHVKASRISAAILGIAALSTVVISAPASASSTPQACTGATTSISTSQPTPLATPGCGTDTANFGFVDRTGTYRVGDVLTSSDLAAQGVNTTTVDSYASTSQPVWDEGVAYTGTNQDAAEAASFTITTAATTTASTVQPNVLTGAYAPLTSWTDRAGRRVVYRAGYFTPPSAGFGDAKIRNYHGLNQHTTQNTTQYPAPGYPTPNGGTSYLYRTPVNHVVCSGWSIFRSCKIDKTVWVRAIVDYRNLSDLTPFGVVNSYVEGYTYAPSWVRNALN